MLNTAHLYDPPTAAEAVRGLRQGALPPYADPEGGAGAAEALPDHARRGERWEVHADHHAPTGILGQAFSGIAPLIDASLVTVFLVARFCLSPVQVTR